MIKLVENKVYYKIFDRNFKESTHHYSRLKAKNETELAQVNDNRNKIKEQLSCNNILFLHQIHGIDIIDVDNENDLELEFEADGLVTTKHNIALAIKTADCVPLLMASENGQIIGAAHCGWPGSKKGIVGALSKAMRAKGGANLKALIGPCIHQESYEVDNLYYDSFIQDNSEYRKFFVPSVNSTHFMFDLPGFVKYQLRQNGVEDILQIDEDTYLNELKYPSYRRLCHKGEENKFENILSTIIIKK